MKEQLIHNGKVYLSVTSLTGPAGGKPYAFWGNLYVDSDGNLYNQAKFNGMCEPPSVKYYDVRGAMACRVTRPKKIAEQDTSNDKTSKTVYKRNILEMLPNPFPTVQDVQKSKPVASKPQPVKPKPLDDEHEKIDMYHLFPDDEWAEQTFEGLQITHRMNLYRDGKLETWRHDDDKGDFFTIYHNRMISGLHYKSEIERRFQFLNRDAISEQESKEEGIISISGLYGLSEFTEWSYDMKKDVFIHNGETVNWNIADGEPVISLLQGEHLESMTYEDLIDLINY